MGLAQAVRDFFKAFQGKVGRIEDGDGEPVIVRHVCYVITDERQEIIVKVEPRHQPNKKRGITRHLQRRVTLPKIFAGYTVRYDRLAV